MKKKLFCKSLFLLLFLSISVSASSISNIEKTRSLTKKKSTVKTNQNKEIENGYAILSSPKVLPPCSTNAVTFFCVTPTITSGSWLFVWNVGSGWTNSGQLVTTTSMISLTPVSSTVSPSSVSVKAIYTNNNGNQSTYYVGSCSVPRSTVYESSAVIVGSNTCAGTGSYSLTGLLAGESVSWSVSNSSLVSIANVSVNQVNLTYSGNGDLGELIATITNSCNQSVQKKISLYSGVPQLQGFVCSSFGGNDFCSGTVSVQYTDLPSLNIDDKITANFIGMTSAEKSNNANWEWQPINNLVSISKTLNLARIGMINFGQTGVKVRAKNACGWSDWQELNFEIVEAPLAIFKTAEQNQYQILPSIVKDVLIIEVKEINKLTSKTNIEIFNLQGEIKMKYSIKDKNVLINIPVNLKKGFYMVKLTNENHTETHRIIVE